jgi:hypothetical protein
MSKWDPLLMHAKIVTYISPTRTKPLNTRAGQHALPDPCRDTAVINYCITGNLQGN